MTIELAASSLPFADYNQASYADRKEKKKKAKTPPKHKKPQKARVLSKKL